MTQNLEELREKVALSQRILGMFGLYRETVGHTSARIPGSREMWIRCRGGDEHGMAFTGIDQVRRLDFDGKGPGLGNYNAVAELPIHGEIYKGRSEVGCVIHAHPPYTMMCATVGIELRPILGAFDPQASLSVLGGLPVYERSITVTTTALAATMMAVMGAKDVLLMKQHGNVVTGRSVEEATILAIKIERLARIHWEFAKAGKTPSNISQADLEYFTERRTPGARPPAGPNYAWNYYVKLLENSKGLPVDILA